jgi:hypothetical protein
MISSTELRNKKFLIFLELVKTDESYSDLRKAIDFDYKLDTLEGGFLNKELKTNYTLPNVDF